jgi:hypothetical protein
VSPPAAGKHREVAVNTPEAPGLGYRPGASLDFLPGRRRQLELVLVPKRLLTRFEDK